ncbi:MAG TPA: hypothetical protein VJ453_07425 [Terriglobales bacterium]|nr:hypothetical protein [Terriglobales bacterium]
MHASQGPGASGYARKEDGAGAANFENAVLERLKRLMDSGVTHVLGKNHIRAAITSELAAGK